MMEVRLIFMALVCLCIAQMALAENHNLTFKDPATELRYVKILKNVRCTICQNQTVFDSNSHQAQNMRTQIHTMLNTRLSDNEIYAQLRAEYGDNVLFMPPLQSNTVLLWLGPIFLLLGGVFLVRNVVFNRRRLESRYAC